MARDSKGHQPRTNRPLSTNILEIFLKIYWQIIITGSKYSEFIKRCNPFAWYALMANLQKSLSLPISTHFLPYSFTLSSFSSLSPSSPPPSGTTQSRIFSRLSVEPVIVFAMDLQTYFCCIVFVFLMGLQCMAPARLGWWIREVGRGLFQGLDPTDNPP